MTHLFASTAVFAELALRGWFPVGLAIAIALLAIAGVGLLYAYEAGRIGVVPRLFLAAVRMSIVVAVAFLLLRPVWATEQKSERRRPIAVLIDVSQSMNSPDPRPNQADQWRVAIAFNRAESDGKVPDGSAASALGNLNPRPTRMEVARAALTNPKLDLLTRLEGIGPLEIATFGSRREGKSAAERDWLPKLTGTDPQTGLADQVAELLARDPDDLPAAIVVVTDGRDNASVKATLQSLAQRAADAKVPIHVYGVGSSGFGQLQIRGVDSPEGAFVEDQVSVPVRFRVSGVTRGKATIVLKYGDRVVDRKVVDVKGNTTTDRTEVLKFTPSKDDKDAKTPVLTATVTVTSDGSAETLTDEVVRGMKVRDQKVKVLVIDSVPRYDFKFLQRALLRDRRVEAWFYLTDGDPETMTSGAPWLKELAEVTDGELGLSDDRFRKLLFGDQKGGQPGFDLLILGDLPAKYLTQRHQELIKTFVTEGGGLIHLAGRWHAPAGWVGGPLASVMPVEFEAKKFAVEELRRPDPFYPVAVDASAGHPLIMLEDDPLENAELWGKLDQPAGADLSTRGRKLPALNWHYPVTKLKPGAEAYLVHPRAKTPPPDPKPMPLLAGHYFGKGFVLFVAFDETWRWRFNEADKYFGRFWSQGVYVAGVPRVFGTKLTQLSINTTDPVQGNPNGQVYARLFDQDFKPIVMERLVARLERLDAPADDPKRITTIPLEPLANQPGEYVAPLPFDRTGRFKLHVDPRNDNPADLEYRVSLPPDHELAPGPMDQEKMENLAGETGGTFFREETLGNLPKMVKPQSSPLVTRSESVLWNKWALFIVIALFTLEWVVRKFNSLS